MSSPDSPAMSLLLHHIAPGLGAIVALAMFMSPLKAVLQVRKTGNLGDLNPLPMVAIIANTTAWLIYGCLKQDVYVIAANEPGFLLGLFMTTSCYAFASPQVRDHMMKALLFFACLISGTSIFISMGLSDGDSRIQAAGYLCVSVLLVYYSSPLSVLYKVLVTRSSASLYWPLSIMCCVNASLWIAYGVAVGDAFIWIPNLVGLTLGVIQLILIAVFPSRSQPRPAHEENEHEKRQLLSDTA